MSVHVKERYYPGGALKFRHCFSSEGRYYADGPSIEWYYENGNIRYRYYYLSNRLHRLDGPAQEAFTETGRRTTAAYWLNGKKFSKSDHRRLIALDKINTQLHPDHNFSL